MARKSIRPDWFLWPDIAAFMAHCRAHNIPFRFVGGCVRDTIMGRDIGDIDVASACAPQRIISLFSSPPNRAIPTGLAHGTVTVVVQGRPFEITQLRKDTKCDGRHAIIQPTDDWHEDALRRDFTMNALMLDANGLLYDEVGGYEDAKRGIVRFIGDAKQRIEEDYLRVLRFFRFYATHGIAPLQEAELNACAHTAQHMADLSVERIAQEMVKLLSAVDPAPSLALMQQTHVLPHITHLPHYHTEDIHTLITLEQQYDYKSLWPLRLVVMYREGAALCASRWKCSKADQHLVDLLVKVQAEPYINVKTLLYRYGASYAGMMLLQQALYHQTDIGADIKQLSELAIPVFPLSGKDIIALGVPAGREVGIHLKRLEALWIESHYEMDKEALLIEV